MADLVNFGLRFTVGNGVWVWVGVVRDKKSPEPGRIAYPAVMFAPALGQSRGFGDAGGSNWSIGSALV